VEAFRQFEAVLPNEFRQRQACHLMGAGKPPSLHQGRDLIGKLIRDLYANLSHDDSSGDFFMVLRALTNIHVWSGGKSMHRRGIAGI
jgi:hypothetical protein